MKKTRMPLRVSPIMEASGGDTELPICLNRDATFLAVLSVDEERRSRATNM